jgi:hypothetical protein
MPTLTDRHFACSLLFYKITCRDDCHEFELFGGLGGVEKLLRQLTSLLLGKISYLLNDL